MQGGGIFAIFEPVNICRPASTIVVDAYFNQQPGTEYFPSKIWPVKLPSQYGFHQRLKLRQCEP